MLGRSETRRIKHHQRHGFAPFSASERLLVTFFLVLQVVIVLYFHSLASLNTNPHNAALAASKAEKGGVDDAELQAAVAYVQSFQSFERKLNFLHIPKTAGTAIEQTAAEHNISWGNCLFKHKPIRHVCSYPAGEEWPSNVGWWHLPAQFFPLFHTNPYEGSELFAVIRDPYERMVSEFYYSCTLKNKEWRPNRCNSTRLHDATYMNEWLAHKLRTEDVVDNPALAHLMDNGHFTPQYEYLVAPNEVRMVDYVLVLDHQSDSLRIDFEKLMASFHLPLELIEMQSIGSHGKHEPQGLPNASVTGWQLTAHNLTNTSTFWMKKKFLNDMQLFETLGGG